MTPLEYVQNNVVISSPRKLLYNCIFNKFKMDDVEVKTERKLIGKVSFIFYKVGNTMLVVFEGNPECFESHDG